MRISDWSSDVCSAVLVTPHRDTLTLDLGSPDCRLFPADVLGRAYRDAALQASRAKRLSYGDPRGSLMLRVAIAAMLGAQRGMVVRPQHICIPRGSQAAVTIVARALVERGDIGVRERLSYSPAAFALEAASARIVKGGHEAP